jgi:hypothetical protein
LCICLIWLAIQLGLRSQRESGSIDSRTPVSGTTNKTSNPTSSVAKQRNEITTAKQHTLSEAEAALISLEDSQSNWGETNGRYLAILECLQSGPDAPPPSSLQEPKLVALRMRLSNGLFMAAHCELDSIREETQSRKFTDDLTSIAYAKEQAHRIASLLKYFAVHDALLKSVAVSNGGIYQRNIDDLTNKAMDIHLVCVYNIVVSTIIVSVDNPTCSIGGAMESLKISIANEPGISNHQSKIEAECRKGGVDTFEAALRTLNSAKTFDVRVDPVAPLDEIQTLSLASEPGKTSENSRIAIPIKVFERRATKEESTMIVSLRDRSNRREVEWSASLEAIWPIIDIEPDVKKRLSKTIELRPHLKGKVGEGTGRRLVQVQLSLTDGDRDSLVRARAGFREFKRKLIEKGVLKVAGDVK